MRSVLALIVGLFLFAPGTVHAQISLSVSINLGTQPNWGPTGYDYVEYYYLPEIEVYYSVPAQRYYYFHSGRWRSAGSLPSQYRSFDLYSSYKVVVNEREPWHKHEQYKKQYASSKGRRGQPVIRDSRDSKYFQNKNHPEHENWKKKQKGNSGKQKEKK